MSFSYSNLPAGRGHKKGDHNIYLAEKTFPFTFGHEMQMSKKHTKQIKKHSTKAEG
jgi:hypothetical protein